MAGVDKLHPAFRRLVENLLCCSSTFIYGGNIEICDYATGDIEVHSEQSECDRFCLKIPYCGSVLRWHVLFDSQHPKCPPDIILDSSDSSFCPVLTDLRSLIDWDTSEENSLRLVVYQLLHLFRQHQLHVAEQIDHIKFNTEFLLESNQFCKFDVHVKRREGSEDNVRVKLYIKLPVALSSLPAYLTSESLGDDHVILAVTFHSSDAAHVVPKLRFSPSLERAVGGITNLRIPRWGDEFGSCLMDYVPEICKRVEDKLKEVSDAYDKRKELVSVFLSHFGSSLIEYDAEGFSRVTFLLSYQGFQCLVHIDITPVFPRDPPVFTLQSLYHERNNQPYHMMYQDSQWYSSSLTPEDIVAKTKEILAEQLPAFKALSVSDGSF